MNKGMYVEMHLKNEICQVDISVEEVDIVDLSINREYDIIYNPDNQNVLYQIFSIEIVKNGCKKKIALVGDCYIGTDDCAVLKGERLTILQNDRISQLNVTSGEMVVSKKMDEFGCNFGIYEIETGYIIYGEAEVKMLDFDLFTKWRFSGRDIFVSSTGEKVFQLCNDRIKLRDFNDYEYDIDFNGNVIKSLCRNKIVGGE